MSDPARAATDPSRRLFCLGACHAASALASGAVLPGCGGGGNPAGPSGGGGTPAPSLTVISAPASGGTAAVAIDAGSPLAAVGGAALVRTGAGDVLVTRTAQDMFSALTATCTHEACLITGFRSPNFVCPCHGSQFSPSGAVLNGPATRPLRTYATTFAGTTLTIAI